MKHHCLISNHKKKSTLLNYKNLDKVGKDLFGISIKHPSDIQNSIPILFPYSENILKIIQKRYPSLIFIYIKSSL